MDDRLHMQLFRRQQREAFGQIEPQLMPENPHRAHAGTVRSRNALVADEAEEIKILLHGLILARVVAASQTGRPCGAGAKARRRAGDYERSG